MDANSTRSGALVKVKGNRLGDLLLQVAEVLPLRSDATRFSPIVPRGHEPTRSLVTLDLNSYLFHSDNQTVSGEILFYTRFVCRAYRSVPHRRSPSGTMARRWTRNL